MKWDKVKAIQQMTNKIRKKGIKWERQSQGVIKESMSYRTSEKPSMQLMTKKTRKKAIQAEKGIRERMSKNKGKSIQQMTNTVCKKGRKQVRQRKEGVRERMWNEQGKAIQWRISRKEERWLGNGERTFCLQLTNNFKLSLLLFFCLFKKEFQLCYSIVQGLLVEPNPFLYRQGLAKHRKSNQLPYWPKMINPSSLDQ